MEGGGDRRSGVSVKKGRKRRGTKGTMKREAAAEDRKETGKKEVQRDRGSTEENRPASGDIPSNIITMGYLHFPDECERHREVKSLD